MAFARLVDQYLYQRFFSITSGFSAAGDVETPEADSVRLYARDKSGTYELFYKNEAGVERDLSLIGIASSLTVGSTTATSGTVGSVLFVGTGPVVQQDNANLFWDDTNNRLGIGINSSLVAPLHVKTTGTLVARFDGSSSSAQLNVDYAQASNNRWITYLDASSTPGFRFFNVRRSADAFVLEDNGSTIVGDQANLATSATTGFLYVPACAGTPTGTPTAVTGKIPVVADSTNNKLYIYSGGSWVALN